MTQYRVVTNGITFKVQYWAERDVWIDWCYYETGNLALFDTKEEAFALLHHLEQQDRRVSGPWTEISEED